MNIGYVNSHEKKKETLFEEWGRYVKHIQFSKLLFDVNACQQDDIKDKTNTFTFHKNWIKRRMEK